MEGRARKRVMSHHSPGQRSSCWHGLGAGAGISLGNPYSERQGRQRIPREGTESRSGPAPSADRESRKEQRSAGAAGDVGTVLEGAVEVRVTGADEPRRAGLTETGRAWRPGRTAGAEIQALGECEGLPRHGQTVPEASHESRARAKVGAGRRAGRKETSLVVGSGEKLSCGGLRRLKEHLRIRRIKRGNWARRGKSRGWMDVGPKSETRRGANL